MNTSNLSSPLSVNDVLGGLPETACVTPFGIIDLSNPKESDINVAFIAQVLSRIPRFNGLTGNYGAYSVAQHCVIGAKAMCEETKDEKLALRFLLHDAHEMYLGDIIRPVQKCFGSDFSKQLEAITSKWDKVIYQKFGLKPPSSAEEELVREMDDLMLAYECRKFYPEHFKQQPEIRGVNSTAVNAVILLGLAKAWEEQKAKELFLSFLSAWRT